MGTYCLLVESHKKSFIWHKDLWPLVTLSGKYKVTKFLIGNILKTEPDGDIVMINHHRKSHMAFHLESRAFTFHDLEITMVTQFLVGHILEPDQTEI